MKRVNFIAPSKNQAIHSLLVHLWSIDAKYEMVKKVVTEEGYYVPEDQWNALVSLLDIQSDLDIGMRQNEGVSP